MKTITQLLLFFTLFYSHNSFCQENEIIVKYIIDKNNSINIKNIDSQIFWKTQKNGQIRSSSIKYPHWIYVKIPSNTSKNLLVLGSPNLDTLDIYRKENNRFTKKRYGIHLPFEHRDFHSKFHSFEVKPGDEIYLRLHTLSPISFSIELKNLYELMSYNSYSDFLFAFYFGIVFALCCYNFSIGYMLKRKMFFFYVGYIFFTGLFFLALNGYTHQFLFSRIPFFNRLSKISLNLSYLFALIFCLQYLNIPNKPFINWTKKVLCYFHSLMIIISIFYYDSIISTINQVSSFIVGLFLIGLGIYSYFFIKKKRYMLIYILAWSSYFTGIMLLVLEINNIIPHSSITDIGIYFSSAGEMFLFSIGLSVRISEYKKEKEQAIQNVAEQVLINKKNVENHKLEIEKKVTQRTVHLDNRIKKLKQLFQQELDRGSSINLNYEKLSINLNHVKIFKEILVETNDRTSHLFDHFFILERVKEGIPNHFYWSKELENEKIIIIGNSFGDSFPSSFLSILLNKFFNENITNKTKNSSSEIFNRINEFIYHNFNLTKRKILENQIEISIVIFKKNERKVFISCAKNKVYLVEQNNVKIISGDDVGVGTRQDTNYTLYTYLPKKPLRIYLTTNGLENLIHAKSSKKFGESQIEEILLSMNQEEFSFQKEILENKIDKWIENEKNLNNDTLTIGVLY